MKRMICYFLLCAWILGCIAGCVFHQPGEVTDPSGAATGHNNPSQDTMTSEATSPNVDLNALPNPSWNLYILTSTNEIVYYTSKANNYYGFYIYSKEPLDVYSIDVTLPISHGYEVSVKECALGGIQADVSEWRDEEQFYSADSFSYPLYLAYCGKDFAKLNEMEKVWRTLEEQYDAGGYTELWLNGELSREEYDRLREPHETARAEYESYRDAQWENYLALTAEELPKFYVYRISITFSYETIEAEESFNQLEITIGEQAYRQKIGKITLKGQLENPAPIDWHEDWGGIDGIMGGGGFVRPYNGGVYCVDTIYRFTADRYKLLEKITFMNPSQQIDRVWVEVQPQVGIRTVSLWDMLEPFEVYPGDQVAVYVAYRDEGMEDPGYQTMIYSYLEYSTDGQRYCKYAQCQIDMTQQYYVLYAMLLQELDLESYYTDFYYPREETWRYDTAADPAPKVGGE